MRKFDLEEWLKDTTQEVIIENGRPARIVCWDADESYPVVAIIGGIAYSYSAKGEASDGDYPLYFADTGDDRIRIRLVEYFTNQPDHYLFLGFTKSELLTWLEKQKEPKEQKQIVAVDSDELFKILPRPEVWSEADKKRYESCLRRLSTTNEGGATMNSEWFKKHVYPHPRWKPTEKQMRYLIMAFVFNEDKDMKAVLESLYKDLKKLL